MLLGLDDIDAARATIDEFSAARQIVQRGQRGHHGVEKSLGNFFAVGRGYRIRVHVHADVAHQQQAAAGQRFILAIGSGETHVGIQAAQNLLAAFIEPSRSKSLS